MTKAQKLYEAEKHIWDAIGAIMILEEESKGVEAFGLRAQRDKLEEVQKNLEKQIEEALKSEAK